MRKLLLAVVVLAFVGGAVGWSLSAPTRLSDTELASLEAGDPAKGEQVFWAGGCASCHAAKGAKGDDLLLLGGGLRLETPFGCLLPRTYPPAIRTALVIGRFTTSPTP